jgi:predicted fused transcriptional regulator/phosphomethylpyrimidine kinase
MPGATSVINVRYDTKRIGPINKSVTITSNAANEPTKVIRIKGKVEATDAGATGGAPVKPASTGAPLNKE